MFRYRRSMPASPNNRADLGIGVGLRVPHYQTIVGSRPTMDYFEAISENFMVDGGRALYYLDQVRERYPVVLHGVSLGIGSTSPPSVEYLAGLKRLVRRVDPPFVTDHFCWTRDANHHLHELLPLPLTYEMAERIAERARAIEDYLEVPFALENTSTHARFPGDQLTEWDFVRTVVDEAEIGLLLDVNNLFVAAYNHGFDAYDYLRAIPPERVVQIHLAGHTNHGSHIIDSHVRGIIPAVWELYEAAIAVCGPIPTLVEWDENLESFEALAAEAELARRHRDAALAASGQVREELPRRSLWPHALPGAPAAGSAR